MMLTDSEYKKLRSFLNIAYYSAFILAIYLMSRYVIGIIAPFLIALIVASIIEPCVACFIKRFHFSRGLAAIITVLLLISLILLFGIFVSVTLWAEIKSFFLKIPGYFDSIVQYFKEVSEERSGLFEVLPDDILRFFQAFVEKYNYSELLTGSVGGRVLNYAGNVVVYIPNVLIFSVVTVVSVIFISATFPAVKAFVLCQFSPKNQELICAFKKEMTATIWNYFRSYLFLIFITFSELLMFFLIFEFKHALYLALVIALVDILPIFGVGTVLLPWAAFSFLIGQPWRGLILVCIYIIITVIRQIVEPKIIGEYVGLPPIVALLALWIGLKSFGFIGMFILPITIVVLKNLQQSGKISIWKSPSKIKGE